MKKDATRTKLEDSRNDKPLYTIGIAAELVGITDQTLRLYEKHGLITPHRRNKNRYYSENDIKWLNCVRDLIHDRKVSIEGIKLLLEYAPCWEITNCSSDEKRSCSAFIDKSKACWELRKKRCAQSEDKNCFDCVIYLSHLQKKEGS